MFVISAIRGLFAIPGVLAETFVRAEAMGRTYAANAARSSWLDRQEEASEVLEPRSFVCNTRAAAPVTDPADSLLRYNDIECDTCATERADHPSIRAIACGTPGCPNSSHPSAPGIPHRFERTSPEPIARADARGSGHQTSPDVAAGSQQRANVVGGVASADDLLPGGGTGQPLDREAHEALYAAASELHLAAVYASTQADFARLFALAAEIRDLAHQFEADTN